MQNSHKCTPCEQMREKVKSFNIKIGDCLGHLQTSTEFICVKENQLNQYLSTVAIFEELSHQNFLEVGPYSISRDKSNKTGTAGQHHWTLYIWRKRPPRACRYFWSRKKWRELVPITELSQLQVVITDPKVWHKKGDPKCSTKLFAPPGFTKECSRAYSDSWGDILISFKIFWY